MSCEKMVWTKETPTKPGWYWLKLDNEPPEIIKLLSECEWGGRLYFFNKDGGKNYVPNKAHSCDCPWCNGEWAGPIPPFWGPSILELIPGSDQSIPEPVEPNCGNCFYWSGLKILDKRRCICVYPPLNEGEVSFGGYSKSTDTCSRWRALKSYTYPVEKECCIEWEHLGFAFCPKCGEKL